MANPRDIERAKKGKDSWNAWAKAEMDARRFSTVDFSRAQIGWGDFAGYLFPGDANFAHATITAGGEGGGDFQGAIFEAGAWFLGATFRGEALFRGTIFKAMANFELATFQSEALFTNTAFEGRADFSGATFETKAEFDSATFATVATFNNAIFRGEADFLSASFGSFAGFANAEFEGDAAFVGSAFRGDARFIGATFKRAANFDLSTSSGAPDLRTTRFSLPPTFERGRIGYETTTEVGLWRRMLHCASDATAAPKFRHLKKLANDAKDHESELKFFALELRAKRFHETTGLWAIAANLAYDVLSNYGQSIARPLFALGALTALSTMVIAGVYGVFVQFSLSKLTSAAVLSATNAALLVGSDKWALRLEALKLLTGSDQKSLGLVGESFAYVQSGLSLVLFFLVGLALRNRFRLGSSG